MICATITASTVERAKADLAAAAKVADLAELRLDYLQGPLDLESLLSDRPCRVIVTNRPARQGGFFEGSEADRVTALKEAIALGADYVDVEHDAVGRLGGRLGTRIIVSYHDFEKTPADLRAIARSLLGTGGDIIKIAAYVNDVTEIFRLWQLAGDIGVPKIIVGMGRKGVATRILTRKFGGYLTYAALRSDEASAPAQLTVADLTNVYNFRSIGPDSQVYGVIGNPVAHSVSPHVHNAAFKSDGRNAVYVPLEVDDLESFLAGCRRMDPAGFSVTIPHKEEALRLADEADEITTGIGAANTVLVGPDGLKATNTDWLAATEAIKGALDPGDGLAGKRALLLGAGGAARAVAFGLVSEKAEVTIANRTWERAQRLAADVGSRAVKWKERTEVEADIIANCTSLGMYPAVDITPMPKSSLRGDVIVFDSVYNPRETRLLREAREAGCRIVDGLTMFVGQAIAQYEYWTGGRAPAEVMRKAAVAALGGAESGE